MWCKERQGAIPSELAGSLTSPLPFTILQGQFLPLPTCCNPPEADRTLSTIPISVVPGAVETRPTIHLDLARLNTIHAVYPADQQAIIGPGVGWQDLNEHLSEQGINLFFPVRLS